ncbi:MAG: hypothetical protein HLUCCO07_05775 [Rhodobacteraceae bacterium HLUCCO07]|nr:MAG: hypothetical protein HLUCCO07_05775 [Rhodobacteraceae bacterium HLUCCO07]
MNANQIINLVMRMFIRKAVGRGMNAGINRLAGKGKSREEMSPEERRKARQGKQSARRARQAMKMGRRIGKM